MKKKKNHVPRLRFVFVCYKKKKVCSCKTTINLVTCQVVFLGNLQNKKENKKRKTCKTIKQSIFYSIDQIIRGLMARMVGEFFKHT